MFSYKNGNTFVTIEKDGTKVREYEGTPIFEFPESMDLKITNYCDLHNYCKWCHENSNTSGKHADLKKTAELLRTLPKGIELAIGGGNPLSHPDLIEFLKEVKNMGLIANLTINQLHIKKFFDTIKYLIEEELVYGVGISYSGNHMEQTKELLKLTDNIVFHLIIGVNTLSQMEEISQVHNKVLLLGYKKFRKGEKYFSQDVEDNIKQWYMRLPLFFDKMIIAFDNLSIKQLNIKRYFTEKSWKLFYMGDDGSHTFYIDMVNEKFSINSSSSKTHDIDGSIRDMFSVVKKERLM